VSEQLCGASLQAGVKPRQHPWAAHPELVHEEICLFSSFKAPRKPGAAA